MVSEETKAAKGGGMDWDAFIQLLCEILWHDKPEEERREFIADMQQRFHEKMESGRT